MWPIWCLALHQHTELQSLAGEHTRLHHLQQHHPPFHATPICKIQQTTLTRGASTGSSVGCSTPMLASAKLTWGSHAPKSSNQLPLQPSVLCMDWGLSLPLQLGVFSGISFCELPHKLKLFGTNRSARPCITDVCMSCHCGSCFNYVLKFMCLFDCAWSWL